MTDIVARLYLLGMGLGVLGIGLWGVVSPDSMLASIDLAMSGPGARIEATAMYGGLQLGLAVPMLLGVARADWRRPALLVAAAYVGGLGLGRLVGIGLADQAPTLFWGLTAFELGCAVIAVALWARLGALSHAV